MRPLYRFKRLTVRWNRFWRRMPTGRLLLEMFSVVLAVLLALGAKEWRDHRQNQQLARAALQTVTDEAEDNYVQLGAHVEAHEDLMRRLRGVRSAYIQDRPFPDSLIP